MNPYATAGLAEGITKGADTSTRALVQAADINRQRNIQDTQLERADTQFQQSQKQYKVQMEKQSLELEQLKSQIAKKDTYEAFGAHRTTGDVKYLNQALQNPTIKQLVPDTVRYDQIDPVKDAKLFIGKGVTPENITQNPNRFVKVTKTDGTTDLVDMYGTYAKTGYTKVMREEDIADMTSKTALVTAKTDMIKADVIQSILTDDKLSDTEKLQQITGKFAPRSSAAGQGETADVRNAKHFGELGAKVSNGSATEAEAAEWDAYLLGKGGTSAIGEKKLETTTKDLQQHKVDLNSPYFDVTKLKGEDRVKADSAIRSLEQTPGGKALVKNVATKLGEGLGAVQSGAMELAKLATQQNVQTNMVSETINKLKAYLPEGMADIDPNELKDARFRQAFLSMSSTMLKLQSGLTVSDREMANFGNSFGTLSKNTKINMIGIRTKLNEIIGSYESNKYLEPTLYNAKYRAPIQGLQSVNAQIDRYLEGKGPQQKTQGGHITPTKGSKPPLQVPNGVTATNPKTGEKMRYNGNTKRWEPMQ